MADLQAALRQSWPQALLAFLPLVGLLWVRIGVGFDGLYGQDAHEYARYADALRDWAWTGSDPGWHAWGPGYGVAGALAGGGAALQWISALSLGATALLLVAISRRCAPDLSPMAQFGFVLLTGVLAPAMLVAGLLAMSDMLALALTAGALAAWLALRGGAGGRAVALFLGLAMSATLTRYASALLLLPMGIDVLRLAWQRRYWAGAAAGSAAALTLLGLYWLMKRGDAADPLHHYTLALWSLSNWFARNVSTADGIQHYRLPTLVYVLSALGRPAHLPLLALLAFARPRDLRPGHARLMLASVLLYMAFLAGIPFQNPRFLLPAHLLVAILLLPAWERIWAVSTRQPTRMRGVALALGTILALTEIGQAMRMLVPLVARNRFERQVAETLQAYPPGTLYIFDLDPALRTRGTPQHMINLWRAPIGRFAPNALMLFNPTGLARQWEGRNPMRNWQAANGQFRVRSVEDLGGGWHLYRLRPR